MEYPRTLSDGAFSNQADHKQIHKLQVLNLLRFHRSREIAAAWLQVPVNFTAPSVKRREYIFEFSVDPGRGDFMHSGAMLDHLDRHALNRLAKSIFPNRWTSLYVQ